MNRIRADISQGETSSLVTGKVSGNRVVTVSVMATVVVKSLKCYHIYIICSQ